MENVYKTIFGIKTVNKVAGRGIEIAYAFFLVAQFVFCFAALSVLLDDWNPVFQAMVAAAVVGLALGVKLVLFGGAQFRSRELALTRAQTVRYCEAVVDDL